MTRIALRLIISATFLLPLGAHSAYQSAILLDFRERALDLEFQLPADRLKAALSIDLTALSLLSAVNT